MMEVVPELNFLNTEKIHVFLLYFFLWNVLSRMLSWKLKFTLKKASMSESKNVSKILIILAFPKSKFSQDAMNLQGLVPLSF